MNDAPWRVVPRWQFGECDRCGRPLGRLEPDGSFSCLWCPDEQETSRGETKEKGKP